MWCGGWAALTALLGELRFSTQTLLRGAASRRRAHGANGVVAT